MRGYVGVTDYDWYRFLREREGLREVNFWQPSGGRAFRAIEKSEPFFFKLKAPYNAIAGFGLFVGHEVIPDWRAWEDFGAANGAPDYATMRRRIEQYLPPARLGLKCSYPIGCLMVAEPVFFERDDWVPQPRDWPRHVVQGKRYDMTVGEGARIWKECLDRAAVTRPEFVSEGDAPRFGPGRLVQPRLGQGSFRVSVAHAYANACAVTTEHSMPVLEAAHIKRYADGGAHAVCNGILLRSDLHRLFDSGYVTVTPDYRFEVSPRLRDEWNNGHSYYGWHGQAILLPRTQADRPDKALLAWHNEHKFRD
ncbi:MAG: HNH endonuclease [Planctomycetaceae bacterium]